MNREQVFDDPLAMFGAGDSTGSSAEPNPTAKSAAAVAPITTHKEEFATLKLDKVNVKVKKDKAVGSKAVAAAEANEVVPSTATRTAMAGLATASDAGGLFGSAKIASMDDLLSDLSVKEPRSGGSSARKLAGADDGDGLFAAGTVFKHSVIGQNASSNSTSAAVDTTHKRREYSNLHVTDSNDDTVTDLTVGKMLQREEHDYGLYGQSNVKQGGHTMRSADASATADANIKKQLQELDMLEQLMNSNESSTVVQTTEKKGTISDGNNSTSSGLALFDTASEEPTAIDYNNLNLDDYINSQQEEDSGGLFD